MYAHGQATNKQRRRRRRTTRQKYRHLGSASGGQSVKGLSGSAKLSTRAQWFRGRSIMAGVTPTYEGLTLFHRFD